MGAPLNEASVGIAIHDLLAGDQPLITYKWIARHYNISYDIAKQVLFHYVSTNLKKVHANFLISGWKKQDSHRHAVMIVPHDRLEKAKEKFISITSLHVYSVGLLNSDSQIGLQNVDYDQTERYFSDSLKTGNPYPFSDNRLSAIRISGGGATSAVDTNLKQCSPQPLASPSQRVRLESRDGDLDASDDKSERKSEVPKLSVPGKRAERVAELTEFEGGGGRQSLSSDIPNPKTALDRNEHAGKAKFKQSVETTPNVDNSSCGQKNESSSQSGQKKRKVMQTYINDAGEEVTELVEVGLGGVSDDQVDATDAPAMRQKKEHQSPRPKVDVQKASVNKNQRSIASFFSKK